MQVYALSLLATRSAPARRQRTRHEMMRTQRHLEAKGWRYSGGRAFVCGKIRPVFTKDGEALVA